MNLGANNADIVEFFLADAGEHLQTINDDLLALEQAKEDPRLVDKIFRDVHAIKGSAGMIGFSAVSQFAHKIEDLLAKIRDHNLNLSESVIDFLFQSADMLAHQIENISHGQKEEKSILITFDDLYAELLESSEISNDQGAPQKKTPSQETEIAEPSLAELYIRQNLFDRAAAVYRKILRDDPSNTSIRQMLQETIALQAYIEEIS